MNPGLSILVMCAALGTACSDSAGKKTASPTPTVSPRPTGSPTPNPSQSPEPTPTTSPSPSPSASTGPTPTRKSRCPGDTPALAAGTDLKRYSLTGKEPPARVPFRDPAFGTCIVRITDRARDLKERAQGFTNEYSRVDSFNADGSRMLARSTESTWYLYDTKTMLPLKKLPIEGPVDPRWDPKDPKIIWYTPEMELKRLDVSSGDTSTVRDFSGVFKNKGVSRVWGRYEGSPSDDGQRWAFMASRDDGAAVGIITYDLREEPGNTDKQRGQILGTYDITTHVPPMGVEEGGPDNISFSHSGKWVLVPFNYCERDTPLGTYKRPCGAMVFDAALKTARPLVRTMGHEDLVLLADGREAVVYQDTDTDTIAMIDLESGARVDLLTIDFSKGSLGIHISGRGWKRPGWALISVYDGVPGDQKNWMDGAIFMQELKVGGRTIQLAHHHSSRDDEAGDLDYFAEPHASVSSDFTQVVWTSNWRRTRTNITEIYVADLPAGPPK